MKTSITAKKVELPRGFDDIVEKKLSKFDKFFKDDAEAVIKLSERRNVKILELTITTTGNVFRSEQEDSTYQNALDNALYVIERKLRKNKTRLEKKLREGAFIKTAAYVEDENTAEEGEYNIRVKQFALKPMSPEEAVLQMNMVEHDFFVFENDESGQINVVYKKKDGDYGCIMPYRDK